MPPKREVDKLAAELAKFMLGKSASPKASGKKPKKNRNRAGGGTAQIRFSRTECVTTVTLKSKKASGTVPVHPNSAPILKKLASAFERCRWERVQFFWKPLVSAMYNGAIAMGVDWDSNVAATTRANVMAYAPSKAIPLREDTEKDPLKLDTSKLKARSWWVISEDQPNLKQPCLLAWAADGDSDIAVGEIYMTYTVVLDGPHA